MTTTEQKINDIILNRYSDIVEDFLNSDSEILNKFESFARDWAEQELYDGDEY